MPTSSVTIPPALTPAGFVDREKTEVLRKYGSGAFSFSLSQMIRLTRQMVFRFPAPQVQAPQMLSIADSPATLPETPAAAFAELPIV